MCDLNVFKENFSSMLLMLGQNPAGCLTILPSGSLISMSGLLSEDDNYALFSPSSSESEVKKSLNLFQEYNVPFVVPHFPEYGEQLTKTLESFGLQRTHTYTAMYLNNKREYLPDSDVVEIVDSSESEAWATASWKGFDDDAPLSESYIDFTKHLINCRENVLFILKYNGVAVCSGLLHNSESSCGLYYFSTLPKYRRQGFARRLMNSLAAKAFDSHNILVLLATEEGLPFYKNFGFTAIEKIPIRSLKID